MGIFGNKKHRLIEEYYAQKGFMPKDKPLKGPENNLPLRYKLNVAALAKNQTLPFDRRDDIAYAKKKGNSKLAKALEAQK